MLLNPNNYWIYGIVALVVYLIILSFKSLFYYLLTYKLIVIGLVLLIPVLILFFFYKHLKKVTLVLASILGFVSFDVAYSRHPQFNGSQGDRCDQTCAIPRFHYPSAHKRAAGTKPLLFVSEPEDH